MASAATQRIPDQSFGQTGFFNQPSTTIASSSKPPSAKPRDVVATFNYFKDNEDGSPPAPAIVGKPETYDRPTEPHQVAVHDIRGEEDKYTLDATGFQIVKHISKEKEFVDEDQIKSVYYAETEQLLKDITGASRVFIFDHTIRREPLDQRTTTNAQGEQVRTPTLRGPVQRVHIDQSYKAGKERVSHHLPDLAPELLKGRYQIINIWRPIRTIHKDPLGVAAANSVSDEDLVPIHLVYPDRVGETYSVRYREGQKWHYLHEQSPEEVLLIKCFDSKVDGRARRVPHSAFVDEEYVDWEKRESIEVRSLVFHEDDRE